MMKVWGCDDTRSYIILLVVFVQFNGVQVILHVLEATKRT